MPLSFPSFLTKSFLKRKKWIIVSALAFVPFCLVLLFFAFSSHIPKQWIGYRFSIQNSRLVSSGMGIDISFNFDNISGQKLQGHQMVLKDHDMVLTAESFVWNAGSRFDGARLLHLDQVSGSIGWAKMKADSVDIWMVPREGIRSLDATHFSIVNFGNSVLYSDSVSLGFDSQRVHTDGLMNSLVSGDGRNITWKGISVSDLSAQVKLSSDDVMTDFVADFIGIHLGSIPELENQDGDFSGHAYYTQSLGRLAFQIEYPKASLWIGIGLNPGKPLDLNSLFLGTLKPNDVVGSLDDRGVLDAWLVANKPKGSSMKDWESAVLNALSGHSWISSGALSKDIWSNLFLSSPKRVVWAFRPTQGEDISFLWSHFWNPKSPADGEIWIGGKDRSPDPWNILP